MLSFKEFILVETKGGQSSDDQGKLHELLVGAHLNRLIHGHHAHMSHFRDESGKTPETAHNEIVSRMSHEEYQKQSQQASDAAEKIHAHLKANHPELLKSSKGEHVRVSWTSQPGDHENLTGKKDVGAQSGGADVMVTKHDKTGHATNAVGYSLKRAANRVTLANRGGSSLETQLGMSAGSLTQHDKDHEHRTNAIFKKHGYKEGMSKNEQHKTYTSIRDKTNPTEKEKSLKSELEASDKQRNEAQAKTLTKHLNSNKHHIANLIAPEHTFPHYQAETHPTSGNTHIEDTHKKVKNSFGNDTEVTHEGGRVKIKKQGKTIADVEVRSKGRPAGRASNFCPHVNKSIK